MGPKIWTIGAALVLSASMALAQQQPAFIQIEAQPSLSRAEDRVRDYASYLSSVNGFALGGGWYGIALGPFPPEEAEARLSQLRANGQIPRDSYVEGPDRYRSRFYPVGAGAIAPLDRSAPQDAPEDRTQEDAQPRTRAEPAERAEQGGETLREARAAERRLTRGQREEIQNALKWAGFYSGPIDAAFGPGTRRSMAGWQSENGFETTGVLTTRQRGALLGQYNAVLEDLGFETITDDRAGITIDMPLEIVERREEASPFVRYEPTGELGARVLLISQPGDRATMNGLYEIMQTLEIVPPEGERSRSPSDFTLTGSNGRIVSHTEARLSGGAVKGFTLIWPAGDEQRRTRVLSRMQASFRPVPGAVLDPATVRAEEQSVDLVSGLQIRRPRVTASGFYVDGSGAVLTALDVVEGCGRITLDSAHDAEIVASDAEIGAAILRPTTRLSPRQIAAFRSDPPRLQTEIAVSGYSFGGVLPAPTMTWGTLEDVRGLGGEESVKRLTLAAEPGDVGGPILDTGGAVLGMLLPRDTEGRQLPDSVSFAAKAEALEGLIAQAGLRPGTTRGGSGMRPEDLTSVATTMTVLVSCWE